jgi:hypothetical protein
MSANAMKGKKSRTELLQEALLLEQLGSEWEVTHAAAFSGVSENYIYRSTCKRLRKETDRGVGLRPPVRFRPADVRAWNDARTKKQVA